MPGPSAGSASTSTNDRSSAATSLRPGPRARTRSASRRSAARAVSAVSTRSATGAGVRLGRAGRGRQVRLEHLAGRAVAEAAPRRVVEPVGEPAEVGPRERLGRALARQEAPGAAVQVLDAALLPGGVRVAEVGLHREVAVEGGVAGALG